jgi:hypothetical protein
VVGYESYNKRKKIPAKKGEKSEKKRIFPIAFLKYDLYNESISGGKWSKVYRFPTMWGGGEAG